jgi:hypothetical protein
VHAQIDDVVSAAGGGASDADLEKLLQGSDTWTVAG